MRASEALRADVVAEREAFSEWMREVDPGRLVSVDESGIVVGMRKAYGWGRRGMRIIDRAPTRHGRRLSLIGCVNFFGEGTIAYKWGTVRRDDFLRFVDEDLVPALHRGDIVLLDNAQIHAQAETERRVAAVGAEVKWLPRYCPDLSPIEMFWSKSKHYVRRERPDTDDDLVEALLSAMKQIRWTDLLGWFRHAGYCPASS